MVHVLSAVDSSCLWTCAVCIIFVFVLRTLHVSHSRPDLQMLRRRVMRTVVVAVVAVVAVVVVVVALALVLALVLVLVLLSSPLTRHLFLTFSRLDSTGEDSRAREDP